MPTATTRLFDARLYREAYDLTAEVRDYVAGHPEKDAMAAGMRFAVSVEEYRMTARLTQVLAWLMRRRAEMAGEVSPDAAGDRALGGQGVCLSRAGLAEDRAPAALADLLVRSRQIYERVARLDAEEPVRT